MYAPLPLPTTSLEQLQTSFTRILPRIELHARIGFRHLRCPQKRDDRIADTIALAWQWHRRLAEQGKDSTQFPTALATYAVKAVKAGRRVTGTENAGDVLSERAQSRHDFNVSALPLSTRTPHQHLYGDSRGQQHLDTFEERLQDNTHTPVPEQVCFRVDFPEWVGTRTDRDRRLIAAMAQNERTLDLSRKFGVSPGRISQLRREYQEDWNRFTDSDRWAS